jgi:L-threonylcarbamoyladenylate synthase
MRTFLKNTHLLFNCSIRLTSKYCTFGEALSSIRTRSGESLTMAGPSAYHTSVLPVDARKLGRLTAVPCPGDLLDELEIELDENSEDAQNLRKAAGQLKSSDVAVAFPTETVYGLGGDATRSESVRSIFRAKQRPADNPLIVHFASLRQLRELLTSAQPSVNGGTTSSSLNNSIPAIYHPLIKRFWPGPLTIILPSPISSPLASEVTAGLNTFGARMPRHALALALIQLAGVPVAAPSANASTKPSPTAAEHVAHDLDGRIETIIDGGPCEVGVESTVVDGLSDPPLILRPGGISLEHIRLCPGWENVQIGYKNVAETGSKPRAPGMKYRHYSPKATVVLYEAGMRPPALKEICQYIGPSRKIGLIRTRRWNVKTQDSEHPMTIQDHKELSNGINGALRKQEQAPGFAGLLEAMNAIQEPRKSLVTHQLSTEASTISLLDIPLGANTAGIARGIFAALRELDLQDVDAIFVEGIDENEGETAAAIMNRLRKAAEVKVST